MKKYTRLTLDEREKIYILKQRGQNVTRIADTLGRHKSTISRELQRCSREHLGYLPDRANNLAGILAKRNYGVFYNSELKNYVIKFLEEGWSPEQISGRLKLEQSHLRVSHETIYKYIYSAEGQKRKLYLQLVRKKSTRQARWSRKARKSHIPTTAAISHRPKSIEKRKTFGHWEGDLVVFSPLKSHNITTLVERKSRYCKLTFNKSKYTREVIGGIKNTLQQLPKKFLKTITFDRGTEFASYLQLGLSTYFCNPHSPWQKGANENFNGRLRKYFPKGKIPHNLSQDTLDIIEHKMNNQPRKCLGFKTPAEVLNRKINFFVALGP